MLFYFFLNLILATQTYGQYRQAQSVAQSADQSAARPADQANQLLGLLAAASCQQSRPAQPGSYPGYPTSNQVNFKNHYQTVYWFSCYVNFDAYFSFYQSNM